MEKVEWRYKLPKGQYALGKKLSQDLSLFYTEQDVRNLFNWQRPMYNNICKLVSQQYLGFSDYAYGSKEELKMSMQAVLTELEVFNFLTEDNKARRLLYAVCSSSEFTRSHRKADIRKA